ncbi:MAG: hypothetical protein ABR964_04290 [Tepidisphaeraceae bacterium]|jgi:hypothetical protein
MQAAKASWLAPIIAVALNVFVPAETRQEKLTRGLISLGMYILGLIFGFIALASMRRYGRGGILVPALIGVCVNGALVLMFTLVIVLALTVR